MRIPERVWLQTWCGHEDEWTWSDHEIDASDAEYIRADLHPSHAQQAVCEAVLYLYSPTGIFLGDEMLARGHDPFPRLWRLVQLVTNAPRPTGSRWAPTEGLLRELVSLMTGVPVEDFTAQLSEFLHTLRYPVREPDGMVVTELEAWEYEGEDGG